MRTTLEVVKDHYAASDRHDLDGMLADLSPQVRWTEMAGFPTAGTWIGRDQIIAKVFEPVGTDWSSFGFTLERLIDAGDHVAALGHYHGTYRASGKSMRVRTLHLWRVEAGQIVAFEQFTDTLLVARAMQA